MQKITFHIPLKLSANKIYSGGHWGHRQKDKELYRSVPFVAKPIDNYPIKCHYNFELKDKLLDISNCFYMVKLIEDCLVKKKILQNDNIKFVSEIKVTQSQSKGGDTCIITIE